MDKIHRFLFEGDVKNKPFTFWSPGDACSTPPLPKKRGHENITQNLQTTKTVSCCFGPTFPSTRNRNYPSVPSPSCHLHGWFAWLSVAPKTNNSIEMILLSSTHPGLRIDLFCHFGWLAVPYWKFQLRHHRFQWCTLGCENAPRMPVGQCFGEICPTNVKLKTELKWCILACHYSGIYPSSLLLGFRKLFLAFFGGGKLGGVWGDERVGWPRCLRVFGKATSWFIANLWCRGKSAINSSNKKVIDNGDEFILVKQQRISPSSSLQTILGYLGSPFPTLGRRLAVGLWNRLPTSHGRNPDGKKPTTNPTKLWAPNFDASCV